MTIRQIGSLGSPGSDTRYEDTPSGRNKASGTIRKTLCTLIGRHKKADEGSKEQRRFAEEINKQLAKWQEVLEKHRDIVEQFQTVGFLEWRKEIEDKAAVDLQDMPDQEIGRWRDGNPAALVNAITQKLTRGFFKVVDTATDEYERGKRQEERTLAEIDRQSRKKD